MFLLLATNEVRETPIGRNDQINVSLVDIGVSLRGTHPVGKVVHIPTNTPSRVITDTPGLLAALGQAFDLKLWAANSGS